MAKRSQSTTRAGCASGVFLCLLTHFGDWRKPKGKGWGGVPLWFEGSRRARGLAAGMAVSGWRFGKLERTKNRECPFSCIRRSREAADARPTTVRLTQVRHESATRNGAALTDRPGLTSNARLVPIRSAATHRNRKIGGWRGAAAGKQGRSCRFPS